MLIGIPGSGVDEDTRRLIAEVQPAGFILFARNIEDPRQVKELNRELASLCAADTPALLGVDQEGGRVQRIKAPATVWPPMRLVGEASTLTHAVGTALARELRAMGFNLNFAPVADVDSNPANPIIGDRAFAERPEQVAQHVVPFLQAQQSEGIIACAKHFPGHGDTSQDSHLALPVVERSETELRRMELVPFRAAIAGGVGSVMTSHVVYPTWDEDFPATLSPAIVRDILRRELGFGRVVFSDDLEMKAVAGRFPLHQQVEQMTRATVDILLCCETLELQVELFRELVLVQEQDAVLETLTEACVARVHAMREQFLLAPPAPPDMSVVGCQKHLDLALQIRAQAEGRI